MRLGRGGRAVVLQGCGFEQFDVAVDDRLSHAQLCGRAVTLLHRRCEALMGPHRLRYGDRQGNEQFFIDRVAEHAGSIGGIGEFRARGGNDIGGVAVGLSFDRSLKLGEDVKELRVGLFDERAAPGGIGALARESTGGAGERRAVGVLGFPADGG